MKQDKPFHVNFFTTGSIIDPVTLLCLLSSLAVGHNTRLWSYRRPSNLPSGLEWQDASEVMLERALICHEETGSPALGANIFRYRLQSMGAGIWLDTDMLMLKPIMEQHTPVLGWESKKDINNAVLFLPKDSPALALMTEMVSNPYPVPSYLPLKLRLQLKFLHLIGRPRHVSRLPWGVFGPRLLTWSVQQTGEVKYAQSPGVFYPLHYHQAHRLTRDDGNVEADILPETLGIHLWNSILRRPSKLWREHPKGPMLIQPNSFLARHARKEYGLTFPLVIPANS